MFLPPGDTAASCQTLLALMMLGVPGAMLPLAWLAAQRQAADGAASTLGQAFVAAQSLALAGLLGAAGAALAVWAWGPASIAAAAWLPAVRLDALVCTMLALTTFLGWVILCYSRRYLAGDAGQGRYLGWLCATLAAVWLLVVLNNLLLVCLAWSATSLALHQLLTIYPQRPAALMAAHKKFLVSRGADLLCLAAILLLYRSLGTLQIDRIGVMLGSGLPVGDGVRLATLLLAGSVILKSAQLPFHGWLLQVMEAPTPVSALLHAGIVNIGGFLLLRLIALLAAAPAAQQALVVVGGLTAALAALVMMTRVSIKVMLAWSTCAQMGFMLLEIGLGAYPLALLHLVAHSLYKACAFLKAGDTVAQQRRLQGGPAGEARVADHRPGMLASAGTSASADTARWLFTLAGIIAAVLCAGVVIGLDPRRDAAPWLLAGTLAGGLLPLVAAPAQSGQPAGAAGLRIACAIGLVLLYGVWHRLFAGLLPAVTAAPPAGALAVAATCLLGLLIVQQTVLTRPDGRLSRWLYPHAFAGFHLDEIFTRMTLCIWPVRPSAPAPASIYFHHQETQ